MPEVINDANATAGLIVNVLCAPASAMLNPVPTLKYLLLGSVDCCETVRKGCVCTGLFVIAETVVCTVCPFCTTGTNSAPVIAVGAVGNCDIRILDMLWAQIV